LLQMHQLRVIQSGNCHLTRLHVFSSPLCICKQYQRVMRVLMEIHSNVSINNWS
jgi:hypothetical protein